MKKMTNKDLQRKIDGSIRLLQAIQKSHPDDVIEIAYSGGKDSGMCSSKVRNDNTSVIFKQVK